MPGRAPHKVHPAVIDAGVRLSDAVQCEGRRLVLIPEVGSAAQDRFVGPVLTLLNSLGPGIKPKKIVWLQKNGNTAPLYIQLIDHQPGTRINRMKMIKVTD